MREIKFRGKSLFNGEWVFGDLIHRDADTIAIFELDIPFLELVTDIGPETIGQFTGRHDKNGNEIYEGDIVVIPGVTKGYVRYNALYWRYSVAAADEPLETECIQAGIPEECWMVIGNIHDNPELLKTE